MSDVLQVPLFRNIESAGAALKRGTREGSFVDNMKLPVHRWFRFSAGFSAEWVADVISERLPPNGAVLDPFAGSGTTLLVADQLEINSWGFEAHPFIRRVADAKLSWHLDPGEFLSACNEVSQLARKLRQLASTSDNILLTKCYTPEVLIELESLRDAWFQLYASRATSGVHNLVWLAITAILRETSYVGTANWQYLLPNKRKSRVIRPLVAFDQRTAMMAGDMQITQEYGSQSRSHLIATDARSPELAGAPKFDLVLTSPPYPNNFDYADATRLELTFWGEIEKWSDLHKHVRQHLVVACSQHSAAERLVLDELLEATEVDPIREELRTVCEQLAAIRGTKAGRKSYHTMVAGYFLDLARVWHSLRPLCTAEATVCFVVGDSAPYGVHVPVEQWLGRLALAAGFRSFKFDKIRDRNLKWKNRKHRVPLHEGRLWVEG